VEKGLGGRRKLYIPCSERQIDECSLIQYFQDGSKENEKRKENKKMKKKKKKRKWKKRKKKRK